MKKTLNLYHYTTQAGLYGIIDSQSLWFTDIFYLNDATEFQYTFDLVHDALDLLEKACDLMSYKDADNIAYMQIIRLLRNLDMFEYLKKDHGVYVFSLSKKGNDLSQWRAYSGDGGGYCIEFDAEILKIARKLNLNQITCTYNRKKHKEKLKDIINATITKCLNSTKYQEAINNFYKKDTTELTEEETEIIFNVGIGFFADILALAPKFKHERFCDEAEYRFYKYLKKEKGVPLRFRPGKTMLIPYQQIKIAETSAEMPIKRIIVGPTSHPDLSKKAVEDLLMAKSIDCDVKLSEVPYRAIL